MKQKIFCFSKKFIAVIKKFSFKGHQRHFASRIKHRHNTFWKSPDAEIVRNIAMSASEPLSKFTNVKHWQRKLSNKYNAREFARLHNCKVPGLYWKGKDIDTIDFAKLPQYFVIRPTIGHSCSLVFLMANGINLMDKKPYSPEDIKAILSQSLEQNKYLEFLIEEFIKTEESEYKIPDDYKIYIFNGEVAVIEVINRLSPTEGMLSCYDKNWNLIPNTAVNKFDQAPFQQPPRCFAEMMKQAKRLSKTYEIFVRIDFYASDKGAVFGEFTPTPGAANYLTHDAEKIFIRYWDTYCKGKI